MPFGFNLTSAFQIAQFLISTPLDLGRFPLVRTGRPDQQVREQNSVVSQICPDKSANSQILYSVVVVWGANLVKKAHFTFKNTGLVGQ